MPPATTKPSFRKPLAPREPVHPGERFGDRVALLTGWTPLTDEGTGILSHRLVKVSDRRWEYRPTSGFRLAAVVLALVAAGAVAVLLFTPESYMTWILYVIAAACAGTAAACWRGLTRPYFDKNLGHYKGSRDPEATAEHSSMDNFTPLGRIHALQVLSYETSGEKPSPVNELNLVLVNGDRINILDCREIGLIRQDAADLGGFLERPVWEVELD